MDIPRDAAAETRKTQKFRGEKRCGRGRRAMHKHHDLGPQYETCRIMPPGGAPPGPTWPCGATMPPIWGLIIICCCCII